MDANAARLWLRKCMLIVNVSPVCKDLGIDRSNLTKFVNGSDTLSSTKYKMLIAEIKNRLSQIG